jgi:AcrR family transcriptional regulator
MLVARPRRSQRDRSEATRAALTAAAIPLFAERGYHGTPAELVVRRAGVTSGALYHHFRDKRGLLRAVLEAVERELARRVALAARAGSDPWARLELGVAEYLDACGEPEVRRIVLLDGPSVLGWDEWHAIDTAHHLRPLAAALAACMRAGLLERRPVRVLARVVLGALTEAGLAASDDAAGARDAVLWLLGRLRQERAGEAENLGDLKKQVVEEVAPRP